MHALNGTCARYVYFDTINDRLSNVRFQGGCSGNLTAISRLVEGMEIKEVIRILDGVKCGNKNTSCANELVRVLKERS